MSIKFAIKHIHDELAGLRALSHTYSEDIFGYILDGIDQEIEKLRDHLHSLDTRKQPTPTPVPGPSPAVDAPERPYAVEETPSTTDNLAQ